MFTENYLDLYQLDDYTVKLIESVALWKQIDRTIKTASSTQF